MKNLLFDSEKRENMCEHASSSQIRQNGRARGGKRRRIYIYNIYTYNILNRRETGFVIYIYYMNRGETGFVPSKWRNSKIYHAPIDLILDKNA